MIICGAIASSAAGIALPMFVVLFGNSIDSFNNSDLDHLYDEVRKNILDGLFTMWVRAVRRVRYEGSEYILTLNRYVD